jgi:hypothetical protein
MCWPNCSVLNIGFRPADEEEDFASLDDDAFADGWCARENLSEVARGMRKKK